jgi:hypothetical protein
MPSRRRGHNERRDSGQSEGEFRVPPRVARQRAQERLHRAVADHDGGVVRLDLRSLLVLENLPQRPAVS